MEIVLGVSRNNLPPFKKESHGSQEVSLPEEANMLKLSRRKEKRGRTLLILKEQDSHRTW